MPFVVPALAAIGGGSALAGGLAAAGTAASIYGAVKGASGAKQTAAQAGAASQVDIDKLDEQTRRIAKQNALDSAALEQELSPEVVALRKAANESVLASIAPNASENASVNLLLGRLGLPVSSAGPAGSDLLDAAIARAREDLALGGKLPQDVQNLVTRSALAKAGTVGTGLGLGRDITARDLGLTSLDLQRQRLAAASGLAGQDLARNQFNVGTQLTNSNLNARNLLDQISLLQQISQGQFGRSLGAASYGESIARPIVGLDPSSVANATVGNSNNAAAYLANQANIQGAQSGNYLNFAGNIIGGLLGNKGGGFNSSALASAAKAPTKSFFPGLA